MAMKLWGRGAVSVVSIVLLAPGSAGASVQFQNTGSTSGWTRLYVEHNGSITTVTSPVYKGSTSIRARQIYDASYTGRYHCEARQSGMQKRGNDSYYGWTFRLPTNWQFVDQNFNFQQFIASFSCDGAASAGKPTTMTWIRGTALSTRFVTGPNACDRAFTDYTLSTAVGRGIWHRVVIHGRWRSDGTGLFQAWYDGSKKVDHAGASIPATDTAYDGAFGMYANGWHDNGQMLGTQSTREWNIDHLRQATSYNEADPLSGRRPESSLNEEKS